MQLDRLPLMFTPSEMSLPVGLRRAKGTVIETCVFISNFDIFYRE